MNFSVTYENHIVGARVRECIDSMVRNLSSDLAANVHVVFNEAIANAITANLRKGQKEITVAWHQTQGHIRLEVQDRGGGFEYQNFLPKPMPAPEATSGRGIPMMKRLCHKLFYLPTDNGVRLHAIWNLDSG